MTFIKEIQPSGVPTGTFSSIPQTYNALKIVYSVRGSSAATYTNWVLRINQDYTDANYRRTFDFGFASSTTGAEGAADAVIGVINANNSPSNSFSMGEITIPFYASTQFNKEAHLIGSHRRDTNSVYMLTLNSSHEWFSTAAVTRIDLVVPAGNYSAGSILRLSGIYWCRY